MIGIDPGVAKGIGVSKFRENDGVLIRALLTPLGSLVASFRHLEPQIVVIEFPRIYPAANQRGDQNDLLQLARVCGQIEQAALSEGHTVEFVYPRKWKGTIDADVMVERIQERITDEEALRVELPSAGSLHDNVWDAVGIGLHALGRLEPRKVYPR